MRSLFADKLNSILVKRGYFSCALLFSLFITFCSGCTQRGVQDYANLSPQLDLREFFDGELKAYGLLKDRKGKVTRRFTATINASWQGDQGTLIEHFVFDNFEEQSRIWTLTHHSNGYYTGTADDVVGEASGQLNGPAFHWQYNLEIPYNDDTLVVSLDDWLFLIDENHLINETELKKFGFRVGELTLFIEKE